MAATYELEILSGVGVPLARTMQYHMLDYARTVNGVGALSLVINKQNADWDWFEKDHQIRIWRSVSGSAPTLDMSTSWFVGARERVDTEGVYIIDARDATSLLARRIVAYDAGTSYTSKTNFADDMMKEIVRENMGTSATDTARQWSTARWLVQGDRGAAPSITKAFTRRNVLAILQDIAAASAINGTYLAFDVIAYITEYTFVFRTYTGQRGTDQRISNGGAFILSMEAGTLANARYKEDWRDEATVVYAGGQGLADDRVVQSAENATRSSISPFGRTEDFYNALSAGLDTSAVLSAAESELRRKRPRRIFTGEITEQSQLRYGVDYHLGDYVTAEIGDLSFDCRLDTIHIRVDQGNETVRAALRLEEEYG